MVKTNLIQVAITIITVMLIDGDTGVRITVMVTILAETMTLIIVATIIVGLMTMMTEKSFSGKKYV